MIAKETIDQVLERASLVEIASETMRLRRQGSNYLGLCPFHAENSPSFNIRQDRFFHCFGCGASGNAIGFFMKLSGLTFPEAVEQLAQRLGIAVQHEGPSRRVDDSEFKEKMYEANNLAQQFFSEALRTAPKIVVDYLRSRNLSEQAISTFKIGVAPQAGSSLLQFLKSKGFAPELLVKVGLARRSQNGDLYDYFRGRVIFPIYVDQKRIAGFGGRAIPALIDERMKDRTPKYLNSLETPIYEKSKILFGLPQALASLRGAKTLNLVEGYMDVVGLWQSGVKNVVATCGTAVTEQHIRRLSSIVPKVDFIFDGDDAGKRGAGKTFPLFVNSRLEANCVFLPDGEDPDSLASKYGDSAKERLLELERKPLFDCYIEELAIQQGVSNISELGAAAKGRIAKIAAESISKIENPVEKSELQERISFLLKVESSAISSLINSVAAAGVSKDIDEQLLKQQHKPTQIRAIDQLPPIDKEILRCVMGLKGSIAGLILEDDQLCSLLQVECLIFISQLSSALALASENKAEVRRVLTQFGETWVSFWKEADKLSKEIDLLKAFEQLRAQSSRIKLLRELENLEVSLRDCNENDEKMRIAQRRLEVRRQLGSLEGGIGFK